MFRKRQKTRSGCQACRIRHKKCDEERPACSDCRRLKLHCTWIYTQPNSKTQMNLLAGGRRPMSNGLGDLEFNLVPASRYRIKPPERCLGQGYQPFRDQIQFDLTMQSSVSLRDLICKTADSDFQDTSCLIVLALHNGWLRDILASFSAHTFLSPPKQVQDGGDLDASLYQKAVSGLRYHIASAPANSATIEILAAMIFLGMSDSLGTGDATHAIVHFSAAASICKSLRVTSAKSYAELKLYRIAVECWLYNLSTLCLFYEDCDKIMRCIDWTVIDDCFERSSSGASLSLQTSPFLGGMTNVYKLIMQMTWYARQTEPLELRQQQKAVWSATLDALQAQPNDYFVVLPEHLAQLYFSKFMLHIYALRIMLEKIADHKLSASAPKVRSWVEAAQVLLRSSPIQERRNPALAWPLVIFLCAAHDQPTFDFYVSIIAEITDNFDEGHMRRMNRVLDTIRGQRAKETSPLGLLLREKGFFAPCE